MILPGHHFRRHVPWRPGCIIGIFILELFGNAQIRQMQVPFVIINHTLIVKHQVLRLDIPVNDVFTMHKLQPLTNTRRKKPDLLLSELVFLANMIPQIPTRHQVHYQVQRVPVLKRLTHVHQKPVL
jgi:hypothetical protein